MRTIYWTTTSLVALMLLASALAYLFHRGTIEGVRELGFPDHFRLQLAVCKIVGALALVAPGVSWLVREWAYAGVGLFLITAIVAHMAHRDPWFINLINVVFLGLLAASNYYGRLLSTTEQL